MRGRSTTSRTDQTEGQSSLRTRDLGNLPPNMPPKPMLAPHNSRYRQHKHRTISCGKHEHMLGNISSERPPN